MICDYYLQAQRRIYEVVGSGVRTYVGLYPIDLDGRRVSVTYKSDNKGGHDTILNIGTEHHYETPPYLERRQRDGRRNIAEKLKLEAEIAERRAKLLGSWGT